jgi:hypothetical protein
MANNTSTKAQSTTSNETASNKSSSSAGNPRNLAYNNYQQQCVTPPIKKFPEKSDCHIEDRSSLHLPDRR